MKHSSSLALSSAILTLLGASAHAAITYVDAVENTGGNTFATGGSQGVTTWLRTDTTGGDADQWVKRPETDLGFNGNTVLQAVPAGALSAGNSALIPELTTRVSGLASGTYNVWVFFWDQVDNDTQNWVISAGLTSGSLGTFSAPGEPAVAGASTSGVSNASSLTFTTAVSVASTDGLRNLFGVNLGPVAVSGGSPNINLFVDLNIDGNTGTQRVWYDGVGYELVPEPSSALLGGLGALLLLRRRRA